LKKKNFFSGFVFWGSWGVLYPKMVEKFEKKFLGTWWVNSVAEMDGSVSFWEAGSGSALKWKSGSGSVS
jgi:hypothetical protein